MGDAPLSTPLSTPRRRLRDAISLEESISQKLQGDGWQRLLRVGKKIGAVYSLICVFRLGASLRISSYDAACSSLQSVDARIPAGLEDSIVLSLVPSILERLEYAGERGTLRLRDVAAP